MWNSNVVFVPFFGACLFNFICARTTGFSQITAILCCTIITLTRVTNDMPTFFNEHRCTPRINWCCCISGWIIYDIGSVHVSHHIQMRTIRVSNSFIITPNVIHTFKCYVITSVNCYRWCRIILMQKPVN